MPELIATGATGFLVDDIDGAVAAVTAARTLDRAAIRRYAVERFGVARMVDAYIDAYRGLTER